MSYSLLPLVHVEEHSALVGKSKSTCIRIATLAVTKHITAPVCFAVWVLL